jgi:hypothetical protein
LNQATDKTAAKANTATLARRLPRQASTMAIAINRNSRDVMRVLAALPTCAA